MAPWDLQVYRHQWIRQKYSVVPPQCPRTHKLLISPWCHEFKLYVIEEHGISIIASLLAEQVHPALFFSLLMHCLYKSQQVKSYLTYRM